MGRGVRQGQRALNLLVSGVELRVFTGKLLCAWPQALMKNNPQGQIAAKEMLFPFPGGGKWSSVVLIMFMTKVVKRALPFREICKI